MTSSSEINESFIFFICCCFLCVFHALDNWKKAFNANYVGKTTGSNHFVKIMVSLLKFGIR